MMFRCCKLSVRQEINLTRRLHFRQIPVVPQLHQLNMNLYDITYHQALWIWTAITPVIVFCLLFIAAPYGRHAKPNSLWGPLINNRLGWFIMESPSPIGMLYWFSQRTIPDDLNLVGIICFILWEYHYINRAFIYPLQLKSANSI